MRRMFLGIAFVGVAVCADAVAQSELDMNLGASASFVKADAELTAKYKKIIGRLGPEKVPLFRQAERSWIAFRDIECKFGASGVEGGSAYPMIYEGCLERLTLSRIKDFDSYLTCQEGDLSCPSWVSPP